MLSDILLVLLLCKESVRSKIMKNESMIKKRLNIISNN